MISTKAVTVVDREDDNMKQLHEPRKSLNIFCAFRVFRGDYLMLG